MSTNSDPWAELRIPAPGEYSKRLVHGAREIHMYWYRDETDHEGLLVMVPPSISNDEAAKAAMTSRGVSAAVRQNTSRGERFVTIRLEDAAQKELFLKLCDDLIDRALREHEVLAAYRAVCARLKRWQEFLSRGWRNLLSPNEVRGLFAELTFLSEAIDSGRYSDDALIRGWLGPERGQHDFVIADEAIEIKALAGSDRELVRISSEDQLVSHLSTLRLRLYFLVDVKDTPDSESLNEIVRRLSVRFRNDSSTADWFSLRLTQAGYIELPYYDAPRLRVAHSRSYLVREGFPRIVPADLPAGVEDVSYSIRLSAIEPFRSDLS